MSFWEFIADFWKSIESHFKWAVTLAFGSLCLATLGTIGAAGWWAMATLMRILHGLSAHDQVAVITILVAAWLVCIAAVVWAFTASANSRSVLRVVGAAIAVVMREVSERSPEQLQTANEMMAAPPQQITPPSTQPALARTIRGEPTTNAFEPALNSMMDEFYLQPPAPRRVHGDADLRIEVNEVLFWQSNGALGLLGGSPKDVILFNISVTNYGRDEPAAKGWNLFVRIGKTKTDTSTIKTLPANWVVRRLGAFNATYDEPLTPDIVASTQTDPFRKGTPKIGWVAFEMYKPDSHGRAAVPCDLCYYDYGCVWQYAR